jgi:ferric-dicitrate binding protein FerR (iron transport regulator)
MDDKHLHINDLSKESERFFAKGKVAWKKAEAEVWAELESKISADPEVKRVSMKPLLVRWSVAAMLAILIGLSGFVFFYSKTIECAPGQKLLAELPGGSTVDLNSGSALKYFPLKWRVQQKVFFEGEAFFNVQKGKKFSVVSENGITTVLGTTFNVYAREENYRVTCLSGLVEVVSNDNKPVLLHPNHHVELENGKLVMKTNYKSEKAIDWKLNQFYFTGRPLEEVFREIERQYNVQIQFQSGINSRRFSSNFSKPNRVEDVLDYVCKSMKLKFVKQSENVFLIVKVDE